MLLTIEEIKEALKKSLPNIPSKDIERAAQAIIEASGKWQEVDLKDNLGAEVSIQCKDICALGAAHGEGMQIRAFVQKKS
jgi:hypothetical protein